MPRRDAARRGPILLFFYASERVMRHRRSSSKLASTPLFAHLDHAINASSCLVLSPQPRRKRQCGLPCNAWHHPADARWNNGQAFLMERSVVLAFRFALARSVLEETDRAKRSSFLQKQCSAVIGLALKAPLCPGFTAVFVKLPLEPFQLKL